MGKAKLKLPYTISVSLLRRLYLNTVQAIVTYLIILGLLFVFPTSTAWAFDEDGHHKIIDAAADTATKGDDKIPAIPKDVLGALKMRSDVVDASESGKIPGTENDTYEPGHHFDRNPEIDGYEQDGHPNCDWKAFLRGANYVKKQIEAAMDALRAEPSEKSRKDAITAIGNALHALADFYSHSNYVELPDNDKDVLEDALDNPQNYDGNPPKKQLPVDLRIASVDPKAITPLGTMYPSDGITPGRGKQDTYPHGISDFVADLYNATAPTILGIPIWEITEKAQNKDTSYAAQGPVKLLSGQTKHEAAVNAATKRSAKLLKSLYKTLGNNQLWESQLKCQECHSVVPISQDMDIPSTGTIIRPEGGTASSPGTVISIPQGALNTESPIYILNTPWDSTPSSTNEISSKKHIIKVVELWPEGINFEQPVTVTISYTDDDIKAIKPDTLKAYYFDLYGYGNWQEIPESVIDLQNHTVSFQTWHFSEYGIGGEDLETSVSASSLWSLVFITMIGLSLLFWLLSKPKLSNDL